MAASSISTFVLALSLAFPAAPFGTTLDGKRIDSLGPAEAAVVLVFVASDCPISNRYVPEVQHLTRQFPDVRFYLVFPNPGDTAATVRQHLAAFQETIPALLDPMQSLMALTHAKVTPEAVVLLPGNRAVAYAGRIDNRFVSFGHQRLQPTRHDLAEAILAVLHHHPVPTPAGRPVGCSIVPR